MAGLREWSSSKPTYTVISTTLSQENEDAELDTRSGDFRSADEVIGYARRIAEEQFELSGELALDFEFSQVAVYVGAAAYTQAD